MKQNDPFLIFENWFYKANENETNDHNAMTLSTIASDGFPCSRVVLLKKFSKNGFTFFTNKKSSKGIEIKKNNKVSLNFYWKSIYRQIRIKGLAFETSDKINDEYFYERDYLSQIGAIASEQSKIIKSRKILLNKIENLKKKYPENPKRPEHWGGYTIIPNYFEFWEGKKYRIHDRSVFIKNENEKWDSYTINP